MSTIDTYLPFTGFYYSVIDDYIDYEVGEQAGEQAVQNLNYKPIYERVAVDYCDWFVNFLVYSLGELGLILHNDKEISVPCKLEQPRFYNYDTDKILATLPTAILPTPDALDEAFPGFSLHWRKFIARECASREGFISFQPSEIDKNLLNGKFADANLWHVHFYLLLICKYLLEVDLDSVEFALAEQYLFRAICSGSIIDIVGEVLSGRDNY